MEREEGRKERKLRGREGSFCESPRISCGIFARAGARRTILLRLGSFSNKYGVCGLFTRCFSGSAANWWRPQGGTKNRIPRHVTLTHPANHRASGNCLRPVNPAPLI